MNIEKIQDEDGVYQGDILEKVVIPEQKTADPVKNIERFKHGKGV